MTHVFKLNTHVIAHRGASAYAPENTMPAFVKAVQLGATWLEFDVQLSADGQLVIFHDESLERTSNGRGLLCHHSFHYLRSLDAGRWFDAVYASERLPTFSEVMHFAQKMGLGVNIEIKPELGQEKAIVDKIRSEIALFMDINNDNVLFSSFNIPAIRYLRQQEAEVAIGLLMHEWMEDWKVHCEALQAVSINVNHEIMTPLLAKNIKESGRALLCYTVNEPDRAKALYAMGVDAVFSDTPDKMLSL